MKLSVRQENIMVDGRFLFASITVVVVTGLLLFRLWHVQIYKGDYYRDVAERNRVRRTEIPASRGIIYDRNGEVLLGNRPFFDLVYIPQYVRDTDTTFRILSRIMHSSTEELEQRLKLARGQPEFFPITLKRNLSLHEVSLIESNRIFLPGIEVRMAPRRDYKPATPAHMVGYLREIDRNALDTYNRDDLGNNPYLLGDLVGKQGLEARWEKYLRGKRGYRLIQVDAYGRQTQGPEFKNLNLPVVPAESGNDLELTIDLKLQNAAQEAFSGKQGAVIILNPQNGEILAELSEPGYDPAKMQTGISSEEWRILNLNPFKPFLDKTTGGEFPPGSLYKAIVALAALQEGVITPNKTYFCPGHFSMGNQTFYCHKRTGHGMMNLHRAIMQSCDVFFYQVGVELGVDRIARYAKDFFLGQRLGVELNAERPGLVPTSAWKKKVHGVSWAPGDTPNIAIGQGYDLMTPMQIVTLYAAIANGGKIWQPHLVRKVTNHVGATVMSVEPRLLSTVTSISQENFAIVREALEAVVMDPEGTGKQARVQGHDVAGKTGSVQVVGLERNRNQQNVSMKWKEHALFVAFSPVENAQIVVAIISENDSIGGGGKSAAPVAQKILQAYWDEQDRKNGVNVGADKEAATKKAQKEEDAKKAQQEDAAKKAREEQAAMKTQQEDATAPDVEEDNHDTD